MFTRYLDVTTDFGFKKLFGEEESKPVLKHFLFDLLELPSPIVELTFLPTEQRPRTPQERKGIFDVYCQDESGRRFIVEMQKTKQHYFRERALYYATFPISQQAERGDWDFQLSAVYCVGILDFRFEADDRYLRRLQILDVETYQVFSDKLTFVYVELPKFNLTISELKREREKWIYFLKHSTELQEVPQAFHEEPFTLAFHQAELAQLSEVDRYYYEGSLKEKRDRYASEKTAKEEARAEGIEEGRAEGVAIGEKSKALQIAQALIAQQMPLQTILQVTGLTVEELRPFLLVASNE